MSARNMRNDILLRTTLEDLGQVGSSAVPAVLFIYNHQICLVIILLRWPQILNGLNNQVFYTQNMIDHAAYLSIGLLGTVAVIASISISFKACSVKCIT